MFGESGPGAVTGLSRIRRGAAHVHEGVGASRQGEDTRPLEGQSVLECRCHCGTEAPSPVTVTIRMSHRRQNAELPRPCPLNWHYLHGHRL